MEYEEKDDDHQNMDDNQSQSVNSNDSELDTIEDFARNPMMERVQRALRQQLQNTYERIKRDSLEQQQELRSAKKKREDCGVDLYGMQQQLARLQTNLDSANEGHLDLIDERAKGDKGMEGAKTIQFEKKRKLDDMTKSISKWKVELDELLSSTKQARLFNQEKKNEVAISRRAASKGEETVKGLQKGKWTQDIYIDSIYERIESLEQDTNLSEEQLSIQKKLTSDTDEVIKETVTDLEALLFEKKQLVQQWDSSILALGRRDQALSAASRAFKKAEDTIMDRRSEIVGLNREMRQLDDDREIMQFNCNKLESEVKFIEDELQKLEIDQESIAGRFDIISKGVSKTSEEEKMVEKAIRKRQSETLALSQKIEAITRERKELEDRAGTHQHDKKNISQTIISLTKKERVVSGKIHEKEIEIANIQNELARLKIDALNTEAHTSRLDGTLNEEKNKLDEKDDMIVKLETEIRRRHDEIEGKMNKVDRLNRKYEQMLDGADEEEHLGPLESTIKALQKSINEMENDIQTQQKEWINNQTILIRTIGKTELLESERRQIVATLNILKQKRLRLIQNIHTNDATLKIILSRIKGMHTDMSRLNELIGKNTETEMEVANNNSVMEMEFVHELKELEHESEQIESRILGVKNAKDKIINDILDVEKQILFWEKKIHMEKEIQATLNSSDHVHETKGMEKEIHRMKHRLDCMKRDQENMLRKMELAIHKKEDIAVKYQHARHGGTKKMTISELKKKKATLIKQRKDIEEEKRKVIEQGTMMKGKEQELFDELTIKSNELDLIKDTNLKLQRDVNFNLFEKQRLLTKITRFQMLLNKFQSLQKGERDVLDHRTEQVSIEKRSAIAQDKQRRIKNAIAGLRVHHTQYDEVFNRVKVLIDDKL